MLGQTFYRLASCALIVALVGACDARPNSQLDRRGLLDHLLEDGPEVAGVSDTLVTSAREAEKAKNYGRALGHYQQLADKYPDNLEYHLKMADNLRRLEKLDQAIVAYDKVLVRHQRHVPALEGKGLALISKGDFSAASAHLERAMMMDRNRWRTLNGVGLLFVAKRMPKEAIAYFDSALIHVPDHPTVLNNAGLTLALVGNYPRAIAVLNRAGGKLGQASPERQRVDMNLALVLGLSGDMQRAEKVAARHLQGAALQNNMGLYAQLAGDGDLAKAYLNSALSGSSTFYERAWHNLNDVN